MESFKNAVAAMPSWIWLAAAAAIVFVLLVTTLCLSARMRKLRISAKRVSRSMRENRAADALENAILILGKENGVGDYLNGMCAERALQNFGTLISSIKSALHWVFAAIIGVAGGILILCASTSNFFHAILIVVVSLIGAVAVATVGACFHRANVRAYAQLCQELNEAYASVSGATHVDLSTIPAVLKGLGGSDHNAPVMADEEMLEDSFIVRSAEEAVDVKEKNNFADIDFQNDYDMFAGDMDAELSKAFESINQEIELPVDRELWQVIDEKLEAADRALEDATEETCDADTEETDRIESETTDTYGTETDADGIDAETTDKEETYGTDTEVTDTDGKEAEATEEADAERTEGTGSEETDAEEAEFAETEEREITSSEETIEAGQRVADDYQETKTDTAESIENASDEDKELDKIDAQDDGVIEPPVIPTELTGEEKPESSQEQEAEDRERSGSALDTVTDGGREEINTDSEVDALCRRVEDFLCAQTPSAEERKLLAAELRAERVRQHSQSDKKKLKDIIFKFLAAK